MNFGAAVEVAIGLFLLYLALSLIITSGNEFFSQLLDLRARHLRGALKAMVSGGGKGDDTLKKLLAHPFLDVAGKVGSNKPFGIPMPFATGMPSYVKSGDFAVAMSSVVKASTAAADFSQAIDKLPDGSLKASLVAVRDKAVAEGTTLEKAVESWFDTMMERVTGAYKRAINVLGLLAGVALAILANANTLSVADALWRNETLRAGVARAAEGHIECINKAGNDESKRKACNDANTAWGMLEKLPIGWGKDPKEPKFWDQSSLRIAHSILGWIITGLALSLGAPFWFDILSKAMTLRAALSPTQRRPGTAPATP